MSVSSKTINLTDRSSAPGMRYEAVDLSSTDYTPTGGSFRELYVGAAGGTNTLVIKDAGSVNTTFTGILGGTIHRIGGIGIIKTGTTATGLVATID